MVEARVRASLRIQSSFFCMEDLSELFCHKSIWNPSCSQLRCTNSKRCGSATTNPDSEVGLKRAAMSKDKCLNTKVPNAITLKLFGPSIEERRYDHHHS